MVQSSIENVATEGFGGEHAGDERFEFDVTMVEGWWNRSSKLKLVGLKVVLFRLSPILALAGCFCASETADHGTEMPRPGAGADRPSSTTVGTYIRLTEHFDADNKVTRHLQAFGEHGSAAPNQVSTFAAHSLFDLVRLFFDASPVVVEGVYMNVDVAEAIVVVGGVLIVDASFELETGRGNVRYDPFAIPDGIGGSSDGWGTESHVRILLVSGWEVDVQLGQDVWV